MRDPVLDRAFEKRGMVTAVARRCGISTAAVSRWDKVPLGRVDDVAFVTGVPRSELRPDAYPPDVLGEAA